jgi:hypothetical protein
VKSGETARHRTTEQRAERRSEQHLLLLWPARIMIFNGFGAAVASETASPVKTVSTSVAADCMADPKLCFFGAARKL